jgi:hypothetical protein
MSLADRLKKAKEKAEAKLAAAEKKKADAKARLRGKEKKKLLK